MTSKDYRFDIIEWRRQQVGWSFDELAEKAGTSGDTALRACKGGNITIRTLRLVAEALGLNGDRLLDRTLIRRHFNAAVLPGQLKAKRRGVNGPPSRVAQNTR